MLLTSLQLDRSAFKAGTGWEITNEGACKGDICVPLEDTQSEMLDIEKLANALGMPLVEESQLGIWSLGPESINSKALTSAQAPEMILPDLDGKPFHLSSLLGKKVVVYAWAPY